MTVDISDVAQSLSVIDEVIDGHRADISKLALVMAEQRFEYGWLVKIPGFGYDVLLRQLRNSTTQLETLLLFREAVITYSKRSTNGYTFCLR